MRADRELVLVLEMDLEGELAERLVPAFPLAVERNRVRGALAMAKVTG